MIGLSGAPFGYDCLRTVDSLTLQKSRARRCARMVMGCGFFSFVLGLYSASYDKTLHMPLWFVAFHACIEVPVGLWFISLGKPDTLRFDLANRIYERHTGWPPLVRTQSKSMTLLYGVFVCMNSSQSGSRCLVGISGASLRPQYLFLGSFSARSAAESYASDLQNWLGITETSPPSRFRRLPPVGVASAARKR